MPTALEVLRKTRELVPGVLEDFDEDFQEAFSPEEDVMNMVKMPVGKSEYDNGFMGRFQFNDNRNMLWTIRNKCMNADQDVHGKKIFDTVVRMCHLIDAEAPLALCMTLQRNDMSDFRYYVGDVGKHDTITANWFGAFENFNVGREIIMRLNLKIRSIANDFYTSSPQESLLAGISDPEDLKDLSQFGHWYGFNNRSNEHAMCLLSHVVGCHPFGKEALKNKAVPEHQIIIRDRSASDILTADAMFGLARAMIREGDVDSDHILYIMHVAIFLDPTRIDLLASVRLDIMVFCKWKTMKIFLNKVLIPYLIHEVKLGSESATQALQRELGLWGNNYTRPRKLPSHLFASCMVCAEPAVEGFDCKHCTVTTVPEWSKIKARMFCSDECVEKGYHKHVKDDHPKVLCAACGIEMQGKRFKCRMCLEKGVVKEYYCNEECWKLSKPLHMQKMHKQ